MFLLCSIAEQASIIEEKKKMEENKQKEFICQF